MSLYSFDNSDSGRRLNFRVKRLEGSLPRTRGDAVQTTTSGLTPIPADPLSVTQAVDGQVMTFDGQTQQYIPRSIPGPYASDADAKAAGVGIGSTYYRAGGAVYVRLT